MTSPFVSVSSRAAGRQSTQLRAASRLSATSAHSQISGRLSTRSQAMDPVIELMNRMFDKVADDAAAQRTDAAAHAAAQRADADRREQQMQVRMDAEFARRDAEMLHREQEIAEKTRLQMELVQLKKDIAAERRQTAVQLSSLPATVQLDVHADGMTSGTSSTLSRERAAEMISAGSHILVTADSISTGARACRHSARYTTGA